MITFKNQLEIDTGNIRQDYMEGIPHLVAPIIMLKAGTWSGSHGPLAYSEEVLKQSAPEWNHRPILWNHPTSGYSGCSVPVINQLKIGSIQNTFYDDGLKAEAWINISRCKSIAPVVLKNVWDKKVMEVSTGLTGHTVKNESGEESLADLVPDHLAILPKECGAFSVSDGGGMPRYNASNPSWSNVSSMLWGNEKMRSWLDANHPKAYFYIKDIFADKFVAEVCDYNDEDNQSVTLYFEGTYSVGEKGAINVGDSFTQVNEVTTYVPINNMENLVMSENEGKTAEQIVETSLVPQLPVYVKLGDLLNSGQLDAALSAQLKQSTEFMVATKKDVVAKILANGLNVLDEAELESMPLERLAVIEGKLVEVSKVPETEEAATTDDDVPANDDGVVTPLNYSAQAPPKTNSSGTEEVQPFLVNVFKKVEK